MDLFDQQKDIFGKVFLLANKLQIIGDAHLKEHDITIKQWFLITVISHFDDSPMITEVASMMGSSRQNVKQLANKLQDRGFVTIEKDRQDSRILRLKLTTKNEVFWSETAEKDRDFILTLFKGLSIDEITHMYSGINKVLEQIDYIEKN
ncbi:MarR family winged helix-turn-helix transcriptional regulator [Haloplasma contractile]|uniref:MarR-family transcriptional regulator protein n=1 Tax=Haloplasma contractile SSD-17B TaxID=1033810 RepID=F7Q237_9MOLU|nr:MarR family transcriptional regulator [Haloplasma contractile]ERJ12156.1 MarR-family transcriptional regulator protein [Haloplasma contractile SSD-17B]